MFLIDLSSPGVAVYPLITMPGGRVNQIVFDNVKVPPDNIVGEKNQGWYHAATTLDFERSGAGGVGDLRRLFDDLMDFLKEHPHRGEWVASSQAIKHQLAQHLIDIEVAWCMSYRIAWMQDQGRIPNVEASMAKLFRSELGQRVTHTGMQILGEYGLLEKAEAKRWMRLRDELNQKWMSSMVGTIAGGTSEIQRTIIAIRGLGLPR